MAKSTQAGRPIAMKSAVLGPDDLLAVSVSVDEGISRLFSIRVEALAEVGASIQLDQLLGNPVFVRFALPQNKERFYHGICSRASQGESDTEFTDYSLEVVPAVWLLTKRAQSRIFQQMSVPDILKEVLKGIDFKLELQGTFHPRDYCVQYRETDFNFACRLMEEEGVYYFFRHSKDGHQLVLANTPSSHTDVPVFPNIIYKNVTQGQDQDFIFDLGKTQEITAGKVTLRDHCFELPRQNLEAERSIQDSVAVGSAAHKLKVANNSSLELYDFPGEYAQRFDGIAPGGAERPAELKKIFDDNIRTAGIRMEQEAVAAVVVYGRSSCRQMTAGHKFNLSTQGGDAVAARLKPGGPYVLTVVRHVASLGNAFRSGSGDFNFFNSFECIPLGLPFRPPRTAAKPVVIGVQTAVVVGPPDEEIFTDKFGRVKVQFHWDRQGKNDAGSSCWVRVGTPWAGENWGAIHIPRVGMEVVVDFLEGDPDQPLIVGCVYNADNMPPYKLPDERTKSGIKSRSTLKGTPDNFNEIRFEDLKGKEEIHIHAERNMVRIVEANDNINIGHNRSDTVNHNLTVSVGPGAKNPDPRKDGTATTTIFGDTKTTITKGDYSLDVAAGKMDEHVKGPVTQTYDDTLTTNVKNAVALTSSTAGVTITGGTEVKLVCGAASITMKKDGTIDIKGVKVSIDGTASVSITSAKIDIIASGITTVKGATVKINC